MWPKGYPAWTTKIAPLSAVKYSVATFWSLNFKFLQTKLTFKDFEGYYTPFPLLANID